MFLSKLRSRNWRAVLSGQRQWTLVVCLVLHTGRNPSEFRAVHELHAEFYGPDRLNGVHWKRRVHGPRGSEFHQGVHRAHVEPGRWRQEDIHAEANKLSAEDNARREVGPGR